MIRIVASCLEDTESPQTWTRLLGEKSSILSDLLSYDVNSLDERTCSALVVCGLEPSSILENFSKNSMAGNLAARLIGDREDLTPEELEQIAEKIALESLSNHREEEDTSRVNPTTLAHTEVLHRLIRKAYFTGQILIVGIGGGAIQVCSALGGEVMTRKEEVRLNFDATCEEPERILTDILSFVEVDDELANESTTLTRIALSSIERLPIRSRTITTNSESNEILAFLTESETSNNGNKIGVLCINGNPEVLPESILEEWLPTLDDHLLLNSTNALQTLEKCRALTGDSCGTFWITVIQRFLLSDKRDLRILELEAKVKKLERMNLELRQQVEALLSVSHSVTDLESPENVTSNENENKIRAILAGTELDASEETIERAETGLIDLMQPNRSFGEPNELANGPSSILSLITTNDDEGEIIYGCTDKCVRAVQSKECVQLDSAPVCLAVRPLHVPTEICCGNLSGSINIFTKTVDGMLKNLQKVENSPHKKHICGLAYDPLGSGRLATVSKDGFLAFWSADKLSLEAKLGFQPDRLPECCCGVVIKGIGYLAVGKRNHNTISLVPFDSPSDLTSHLDVRLDESLGLNDSPSFAPLAMAAYKDLPLLAVAMDKSKVCLYDLELKKLVREFHGHVCEEFARPSLAWDARGELLAVTSDPNRVFVFRVNRPLAPPVVVEDHRAVVRGVCFKSLSHVSDVSEAQVKEQEQEMITASFDKRILTRKVM